MNEPRRLNRSGGISQRLLDSASLDKPSHASRRHAVNLATTASAFSRSSSGAATAPAVRPRAAKTLAIWLAVGAAASVTLGLFGSKLLDTGTASHAAAPLLGPAPNAPANSPDISPEPPAAPANGVPRSSAPSPEEARQIEVARAALSRGDANGALAQLNAYDSLHPNGLLEPEALALRIQALSLSGKTTEARELADEFQAKYPQHPLGQQLLRNPPR